MPQCFLKKKGDGDTADNWIYEIDEKVYNEQYKSNAMQFPKFKSFFALNFTVTFINFDPSSILNLSQSIFLNESS